MVSWHSHLRKMLLSFALSGASQAIMAGITEGWRGKDSIFSSACPQSLAEIECSERTFRRKREGGLTSSSVMAEVSAESSCASLLLPKGKIPKGWALVPEVKLCFMTWCVISWWSSLSEAYLTFSHARRPVGLYYSIIPLTFTFQVSAVLRLEGLEYHV